MAVSVPHFSKTACSIFFGFGLCIASLAASGYRGVIDDPDGSVNLQTDNRPDAAFIAKVKTGERVSFECEEGDKWCKVTLGSGKSGWIPSNRIRLYFTVKDLPRKGGELGVEYYKVARRAARGDKEALRKFFGSDKILDGAAAEQADDVFGKVIHIMGDAALADFLQGLAVDSDSLHR